MKKYQIDENKLIEFIFENKNKTNDLEEYVFNEGPGLDKLKTKVKNIGKGLVAFATFRFICMYLSVILNRNWQTKKRSFPIIRSIWKESMEVLRFFLNSSNLDKPLYTALQSFYSWELSMASIIVYETLRDGKSISEAKQRIKSLSPEDFKTYISQYAAKIKDGSIGLNKITLKVEEYGGGGGGGGGGRGGGASISTMDISRIFNFLSNPVSLRSTEPPIKKEYTGDYLIFIKLFREAKNKITGLSSDAIKGLEQIIDSLTSNVSNWNSMSSADASLIMTMMKSGPIKFPSNDMSDGTKDIVYSTGDYSVPDDFNFSKVSDAGGRMALDEKHLRLKFMFLFALVFDTENEKDFIIKEMIDKFTFVKNR